MTCHRVGRAVQRLEHQNGEIGLQNLTSSFFYGKFLLRDKYRKTAGLNLCSSCDFKVPHPKPFPGLLSPWCVYSVRPWRWKMLKSRTELPWGAFVPKLYATIAAVETTQQMIGEVKPLPSLPGICVSPTEYVWLLLCGRELVLATLFHFQALFKTEIRGLTMESMLRGV